MDWIFPASSAPRAGQGDAAGDDQPGQVLFAGQRHHHRRQAFIAGGDADHALAGGQRADQPAHDDGRVVAVGQRVEHAGGALRAPVARVADVAGEGQRALARSVSAASRTSRPSSQCPVW